MTHETRSRESAQAAALAMVLVLAGAALGQDRPIRDLRQNDSQGVPLLLNQSVTFTGVVTAAGCFGGYGPVFVQDSTGGVALYGSEAGSLALGDSVTVSGVETLYYGLAEVKQLDVTGHGAATALEPMLFTLPEVDRIDTAAGYVESEGWLISLDSIEIEHDPGAVFEGNTNYDINDPQGHTGQIRIDGDAAEVVGLPIPGDRITLTGVVGQYKPGAPHFGGYQIMPRYSADVGLAPKPLRSIAEVQKPGADGVTPLLKDSVVRVRGRVTGPARVFTSGTYKSLYVEDSSQGINVYGCEYSPSEEVFLDSLGIEWEVQGTVTEYNGLTEISDGRMKVSDRDAVPVQPRVMPFNYPLTERQESGLWLVVGDVVQAPVRSGSGYNLTVKAGTPAVAVRVGDNTGIDLSWVTVGRRIRFIGIGGQYDYDEPYTSGYQLLPRFPTDLYDTTAAFEPSLVMRLDTIAPNPFVPGLGELCTIQVNAPRSYRLTIALYDLEGRLVKELLGNVPGGYYDQKWDGTDRLGRRVPAGTYLLSIKGSSGAGQTEALTRPIAVAVKLN